MLSGKLNSAIPKSEAEACRVHTGRQSMGQLHRNEADGDVELMDSGGASIKLQPPYR